MRVLFLHGWTSVPGGVKPTYLSNAGFEVLNPALPDDDFTASVAIGRRCVDKQRVDCIVGSSRGGAVALNIGVSEVPMVLLCPAWKHWGTATTAPPLTTILHSRRDEIIPFAHSEDLIRNSQLPATSLIEIGTDHRLADPGSLAAMVAAVHALIAAHPAIAQDT